ncbi:MAG TPA: formylglycine-generating enzyme family protein [Planctomycetes bacterium]|nr:formylglycine-generating enzyme family protein [Planctomycetota bacterium]
MSEDEARKHDITECPALDTPTENCENRMISSALFIPPVSLLFCTVTLLLVPSLANLLWSAEPAELKAPKPPWATTIAQDATGTRAILTVGDQTQVMRLIPAGSFEMGSTTGSRDDEMPQHSVEITRPFWLGDSEVTLGLWFAMMGNHTNEKTDNPRLPIEAISWNACQEFFQRMNARVTGLNAGLPTEAQWEYACRAGTKGSHAGDINEMAWHQQNSDGKTHPVRLKQMNAWGLYDMHGNVAELCADWYAPYSPARQCDPPGPPTGTHIVIRGGDCQDVPKLCRSASRGFTYRDYARRGYGFRIAIPSTP